jgi:cell division septation protein DedD
MPPKQEEEFELVLGNKQLLSLFFLAVVLFAVFFSFGYMIGFGRGQQDRASAIASTEAAETPQDEVRLPDTLLEEAPKPVEPHAEMERVTAASHQALTSAPPERRAVPEPERVIPPAPEPERKQELAKAAPKPEPVMKAPAKQEPPQTRPVSASATATDVGRSIHLQVAAVRVKDDAQLLVNKLKAKGYRVSLNDGANDGWFRVVVGPFKDEDSAKADQKRLSADGLNSLLRRP